MHFLVTRPEPECHSTAGKLRAAGHMADEMPLLTVTPNVPTQFDLQGVSALAITSARVPTLLRGHAQFSELTGLPLFAVGDKTAQAALAAGFEDVTSADGDVTALAQTILDNTQAAAEILYPAARERSGDLPGCLHAADRRCTPVEVYRMEAQPCFSETVRNRLESAGYDGVLIYSRRTAQVFSCLLKPFGTANLKPKSTIFAISKAAAEPLEGILPIQIPDHPREDELLKLAITNR